MEVNAHEKKGGRLARTAFAVGCLSLIFGSCAAFAQFPQEMTQKIQRTGRTDHNTSSVAEAGGAIGLLRSDTQTIDPGEKAFGDNRSSVRASAAMMWTGLSHGTVSSDKTLSLVSSSPALPQRAAFPRVPFFAPRNLTKLTELFQTDIQETKTAFWTDDSILLATSRDGKVQIDGFQLSFNGKALAHPSDATPARDALRTLAGTTPMRNAPTFLGVRITLNLGHPTK